MDELFNHPIIPLLLRLPNANEIYLVGGCVRDAFLRRQVLDMDFACQDGIATGRALANANKMDFFILDRERDTCRVIWTRDDGRKEHFDFNGLRAPTIENDLMDRDVRVNAMAMNIATRKLTDPTGGLQDLRDKRLRACSAQSILNDPLRLLRIVRFSITLGFRIDPELVKQMREALPGLGRISSERVRDEFYKILASPKPATGLELLEKFGVLHLLFPRLDGLKGLQQPKPHVNDAWTHTLNVVRHLGTILSVAASPYDEEVANADLFTGMMVLKLGRFRPLLTEYFRGERSAGRDRRANLAFAALFHDVEKPSCRSEEDGRIRFLGHDQAGAKTARQEAETLRHSASEAEAIERIIYNHMRIHGMVNRMDDGQPPSNKAIYRYFRAMGADGVDLVMLSLADLRATFEHTLTQQKWRNALDVAEMLLNAWYNDQEKLVNPPALLNGHTLMQELGIEPGEVLGVLLESVRENQVSGAILNTEQALAHCREKYAGILAREGKVN